MPALIDPLGVPDVFATHAEVELLADHARITLSALRTNEFGERVRPVVSRTVLTTDSLFGCLEAVLEVLTRSGDARVERRMMTVLARLMAAHIAPTPGTPHRN